MQAVVPLELDPSMASLERRLRSAASRGKLPEVQDLVAQGADVNHRDPADHDGWTALHRGLRFPAIVEVLLQNGASATLPALAHDVLPLHTAAIRRVCLRAPVKILLRAGAGTATEHPRIQRHDGNAAAFEVVDRVKAVGDWKAYAGKHQRVLAGLVSKCAPRAASPLASKCVSPLPDDAGASSCASGALKVAIRRKKKRRR